MFYIIHHPTGIGELWFVGIREYGYNNPFPVRLICTASADCIKTLYKALGGKA